MAAILETNSKPVRYADDLHDAVVRYLEAERVINALDESVKGTPAEKAFHAVIEEIGKAEYVATTAAGAMAALRLAQRELDEFADSEMTKALVDGAMAYFDEIEKTSGSALHDGLGMLQAFPEPQGIEGAGWAAVYDGLTCCIEILSGIANQPRGAGDAGAYLESIDDFLRQERRRIMRAAVDCDDESRDDGNHTRLVAAIQFLAEEADLRYNDKVALLAFIKAMEAQQ